MKQLRVLSLPYLVWMVIFIVVPIIMVAVFAFTTSDGNFTIDNISNVGQYANIFVHSIWLALIATAICLVIAYPLAYIMSRMKRMQGYNVLYPIGFDAFGLPTENSAIKFNTHPRILTDKNIENER